MRLAILSLLLLSGCARQRSWQGEHRLDTLQLRSREALVVQGKECGLTLQGDFRSLKVEGHDNYLETRGKFRQLVVGGKSNLVLCRFAPESIVLKGQGNRVRLPGGEPTPHIRVEGQDQAVQFSSPAAEAPPSPTAP